MKLFLTIFVVLLTTGAVAADFNITCQGTGSYEFPSTEVTLSGETPQVELYSVGDLTANLVLVTITDDAGVVSYLMGIQTVEDENLRIAAAPVEQTAAYIEVLKDGDPSFIICENSDSTNLRSKKLVKIL